MEKREAVRYINKKKMERNTPINVEKRKKERRIRKEPEGVKSGTRGR